MARGGKRQPNKPAPVSGPGALSARTDGGPGNASQPVRVATGQPYGVAGALAAQQQAAPLATSQPAPAAAPSAGRSPLPVANAFAPTRRPDEPVNRGLTQPSLFPEDPYLLLRAMYALYPHPDIARLIGS